MHFSAIFKLIGSMLLIFSLSMLPPIVVAILYGEINNDLNSFIIGFAITLAFGFLIWLPFRKSTYELKSREGFLIVALLWITFTFFAAIPFYIYFYPHMSLVDALFESTSGLTTTGGTVFTHIDLMPRGILYYRQQLHFIGGMGIILLAVAVLPLLGIGGMQLYRAEASGPIKTEKLHPRLKHTAKWLWYIYLGIVVLCALCFKLAGMSSFDAIGESFSAVSTGGFALHDNSLGYYHSNTIYLIAIIFMLIGSINFSLHYRCVSEFNPRIYWRDEEFRTFIKVLSVVTLIFTLILSITHYYRVDKALFNSLFTVVSLGTTTGYNIADFSKWPSFLPFLTLFITIIGGCGASTAGGLKIIRCLILYKQSNCELNRLIHPQGVVVVKLNQQVLPERVIESVWSFFSVFMMIFIVLFLLLFASGLNALTSFSALATCISNAGAGIGGFMMNYENLNYASKWLLIFAMIIGRLEIFTILVLFTPGYWQK